jgi:hypothetical protein
MSVIPVTRKVKAGGSTIQSQPSIVIKTLSQKQNRNKVTENMAQVAEGFPRKFKALREREREIQKTESIHQNSQGV